VKKQFDQLRRKPPVDKTLPRYAGATMWALGLQRRIGRPMAHLSEIAPLLPHAPELAELQLQHGQVVAAIEQVGFQSFCGFVRLLRKCVVKSTFATGFARSASIFCKSQPSDTVVYA
jgi:hypothetical protein